MYEPKREDPYILIRRDVIESLERYVKHGIMPGGFLTAVLENSLMEAMAKADTYNQATLKPICLYVYNELPASCWGSKEKVDAYLAQLTAATDE